MKLTELRELAREMSAEVDTEEAQNVIHNDETHVSQVWEDGEITFTKSGDLYGRRSLHQRAAPIIEGAELLFDVPDDDNHTKRIIIDDELTEIISELDTLELDVGSTESLIQRV